MNIKQLDRKLRKKAPKTWASIDRRWDIKMIGPVLDFILEVDDHINPRLKKLARNNEFHIDGPEVERSLWKLLRKVRRITQAERRR